jgi:predicted nucleic-acid-binding Zn-ribbon protein
MKSWSRVMVVCCLFLMVSVITADARHRKEQDSTASTGTNTAAPLVDLKCPKCQNQMEHGFLLENQGYNANQTDTKWVQGPVTKRHFPFTDIEVKVQRHVEAYRCTNCGYLELYAR